MFRFSLSSEVAKGLSSGVTKKATCSKPSYHMLIFSTGLPLRFIQGLLRGISPRRNRSLSGRCTGCCCYMVGNKSSGCQVSDATVNWVALGISAGSLSPGEFGSVGMSELFRIERPESSFPVRPVVPVRWGRRRHGRNGMEGSEGIPYMPLPCPKFFISNGPNGCSSVASWRLM